MYEKAVEYDHQCKRQSAFEHERKVLPYMQIEPVAVAGVLSFGCQHHTELIGSFIEIDRDGRVGAVEHRGRHVQRRNYQADYKNNTEIEFDVFGKLLLPL